MNYPFLNYNTPGLQLGQPGGLGGIAPNTTTGYSLPSLDFGGNYNALGNNPTYQSVGSAMGTEIGNYPAGSNWISGTNNWLSNNSDLLKSGIGLITGGIGAWQGFQQNKLVRENMNQQANQFREQMNLSKQNINRNLEDRQRARVASNPVAYESVSDYMKKYGVK